jgi:hypothetical protein
MIDRADFEERIAEVLYGNKRRRSSDYNGYRMMKEAIVEAKQIADRLPALFRTEEIEIG